MCSLVCSNAWTMIVHQNIQCIHRSAVIRKCCFIGSYHNRIYSDGLLFWHHKTHIVPPLSVLLASVSPSLAPSPPARIQTTQVTTQLAHSPMYRRPCVQFSHILTPSTITLRKRMCATTCALITANVRASSAQILGQ